MNTNISSPKLKKDKRSVSKSHPGYKLKTVAGDMKEFELLSNGLLVLFVPRPGTGVITTQIVYQAGARHEAVGETGLAHMLEHMLFKPTTFDRARGTDSAAMLFEREVGVALNANTWKDRTAYYFSYPKEYFSRALTIEAERMRGTCLEDKDFLPERSNVLSEFDMYNGDPEFALAAELCSTAFHSHPYGHETIGFRSDIERYTVKKLVNFYDRYYQPNNAVLLVIGDIEIPQALETIRKVFGTLEPRPVPPEQVIVEPPQEGLRRITIRRPGVTNVTAFAVKHPGFPSKGWFETALVLQLLCDGSESVLHKRLIDTGKAAKISFSQEPTRDENIAFLAVTASRNITLPKLEGEILSTIRSLDQKVINSYYKKLLAKNLTAEIISRDNSLAIAAELTEYVAAGDWVAYTKTESILRSITPRDLLHRAQALFSENNLCLGTYQSK